MTSVNCLCDEESSNNVTCDNSCPSISVNDVNDFIQQLLCYKCKVVDLVNEQIQKSKCQQNNLLSQICETKSDGDEESSRRDKREISDNAASSWLGFNSLRKILLYGILFVLLTIIAIWWIYSKILGNRVCAKSGLCIPVPFVICPPKPRLF